MFARANQTSNDKLETIEYCLQLYLFYIFAGHLVYFNDLVELGSKWQLISLSTAGLILQILYLKTKRVFWSATALILFYCMSYFNPFIGHVGVPILIFTYVQVHLNKTILLSESQNKYINEVFYIFLGLHYFFSGYYKLTNVEWINGAALEFILRPPVTRDWFYEFMSQNRFLNFKSSVGQAICYFELAGILIIFKQLRKFTFILLILFHLQLVLFLNVLQLTIPYFILYTWLYGQIFVQPKNKLRS